MCSTRQTRNTVQDIALAIKTIAKNNGNQWNAKQVVSFLQQKDKNRSESSIRTSLVSSLRQIAINHDYKGNLNHSVPDLCKIVRRYYPKFPRYDGDSVKRIDYNNVFSIFK